MEKVSIKQKKNFLRRAGKVGILLTIKESYLFSRNVFGLGAHPFKTLRRLQREKDRSQQVLVLGMPMYVFLGGLVMVWLGRRFLGTTEDWGVFAKTLGLMVLIATGGLGGYLGYWWMKALKAKYEG